MPKEFESEQYDNIYAASGNRGVYGLPYWRSQYFPLFRRVLHEVRCHGSRSVLEVGCGTGTFAHLLMDKAPTISYRGFDFSPVAVETAARRINLPERFFVGDARSHTSYEFKFDTIVCTEVLEHIEADLDVVRRWPSGVKCICSVPNFDADNHVRFFDSIDSVINRYGGLIDIDSVVKVKKPFVEDIGVGNVLRALWWNRYRPSRAAAILGVSTFEKLGGWFLLTGVRRTG